MNHWAAWLAAAPAALHIAIARANRISLPRGADAATRLRAALCHQQTVREMYFRLPDDAQAALQHLRAQPRGLAEAGLVARYGPLRAPTALRGDPQPRSLSERLVLLGWLLPRPVRGAPRPRYLLAPEVRAWLPRPLALAAVAPSPDPPYPPVLRAAQALLHAGLQHPLALCADGRLRVAVVRELAPQLAPLAAEAGRLLQHTLPLLVDLRLLAVHHAGVAATPAARSFLAQACAVQLARLHAAWIASPRPDGWLPAGGAADRRLRWPTLRRRLIAWSAALPPGRRPIAELYAPLADAFGPLADAHTHVHHAARRSPWNRQRAATVWAAALRTPLAWFGDVTRSADGTTVAATTPTFADGAAWRYVTPDGVAIPHGAGGADLLAILPRLIWVQADATATVYRVGRGPTPAGDGPSAERLRAVLDRRAGPVPPSLEPLLEGAPVVQVRPGLLVLSADPAGLDRAARTRSVRRWLTRLAPGLGVAAPGAADGLTRALERADVTVDASAPPPAAPPEGFTAAECALLLEACRRYRADAPDAGADAALAGVMRRLHALSPDAHIPPPEPEPVHVAPEPEAASVASLRPWPLVVTPEEEARTPWTAATAAAFGIAAIVGVLLRLVVAPDAPDEAAVEPSAPAPPEPAHANPPDPSTPAPAALPLDVRLQRVETAIRRRAPLQVRYSDAAGRVSDRQIRPLTVERNGAHWYIRAYCVQAGGERTFRLDRCTTLDLRVEPRRRGRAPRASPPSSRARATPPSSPPGGFFAAPPPPTGQPLVRIWLAD